MWTRFKIRLTEAINEEDEWGNPTGKAVALAHSTLLIVYLYRLTLMAIFVSVIVWVIVTDRTRFIYNFLF